MRAKSETSWHPLWQGTCYDDGIGSVVVSVESTCAVTLQMYITMSHMASISSPHTYPQVKCMQMGNNGSMVDMSICSRPNE